jgi:hypothetical protein
VSGRSSKGHVRSPGSSRNVVSATSTSAARCRRALHKHTTHHTRAHSAGTHSKGTHSRCTQREHGKRKRAITKACTASAYITGARNASMGDASATTQTCTAPEQSTGRRTHAMSKTLTSGCRTIWEKAAQVHHTPSTKAHSSSTHRMGTRSRHGLKHAHVNDKLHECTVHTIRTRRHAQRGHTERRPEARARRGYARGAQGAHARAWCMLAMSRSACAHPRGRGSRHASAVRRKRGARPVAAKRASPGPPRTPPPPTMGAPVTPPRLRRAAKRARSGPPSAPPRRRPPHARTREAPAPAAAAYPPRPHVPHFSSSGFLLCVV